MTRKRWTSVLACLAAGLMLSGCATNPVTGERELGLVSESQEIAIGEEQYLPSRQMQGGDYRLDPALTEYVSGVGQRLAANSDRKLPYEFVVLNDSSPNAWALPGGKIAVNRGLLVELENEAQLAAVLGHEIVHAAARHGAQGMERGILLQGAVLAAGVAMSDSDYSALASGGAAIAANLINQKYGRDAERESDRYGMEYMARAGYDPAEAVRLQQIFVELSESGDQGWLSGLFASHPPSPERVENNRATLRSLGVRGGEIGRERYQQAVAGLKQSAPAYAAQDKGREALKSGQPARALAWSGEAIAAEDRESRFYALRGDALLELGDPSGALSAYDQAVRLDDSYFEFYVKRGLVRRRIGNERGAREDLEKSVRLLPTVEAYNGLGQLALEEGNRRQATEYFRKAAGSGSQAAQEAQQSLLRLDLGANPGAYLQTRLGVGSRGELQVQIGNPNTLAVSGIRLRLEYPDAQGRYRSRDLRVSGELRPNERKTVATGLGPVQDRSALSRVRIRITAAKVAE
jgi:predicted Zn-dependent protease